MSTQIYKLSRDEVNQALADYITKKYAISDKQEATMDLNIQADESRNTLLATVTIHLPYQHPTNGDTSK